MIAPMLAVLIVALFWTGIASLLWGMHVSVFPAIFMLVFILYSPFFLGKRNTPS